MILATFDLQVTPILTTKFRVSWPLGSGEYVQSRFSRWPPPWFTDQNHLRLFLTASHSDTSYQVFESNGLSVWEEFKTDLSRRRQSWISD